MDCHTGCLSRVWVCLMSSNQSHEERFCRVIKRSINVPIKQTVQNRSLTALKKRKKKRRKRIKHTECYTISRALFHYHTIFCCCCCKFAFYLQPTDRQTYFARKHTFKTENNIIIIIIIYPLIARVVGAPQMISQPVSSICPCSPLPPGTWRTPGLSIT